MKYFGVIMTALSTIASLVLIALIVTMLKGDQIEFTDAEAITKPVLLSSDPMSGATSPSVILVLFGDFASEISSDVYATLQTVLLEFPDTVMVVWKDFPNATLDPESERAAIAARCADKQNRFFEYADLLVRHQFDLGDELYIGAARELELREGAFTRCLNKEKTRSLVEESATQGNALNLTTAPTLFIGEERITGAISVNELRVKINALLGT
ncbi:MAG: thioredoxin domain-containing protein [Patescibacteria group bacterium]